MCLFFQQRVRFHKRRFLFSSLGKISIPLLFYINSRKKENVYVLLCVSRVSDGLHTVIDK